MDIRGVQVWAVVVLALAATQAGAGPSESIGVKVGATTTHMHSSDPAYGDSESAIGLVAGPFVDLPLSRWLALQPALVFARRGGTYHDLPSSLTGSLGEVDELTIRRDYLELHLLLRCRLQPDSAWSPSLVAGPALGRVLSYKVVEDGWELGTQAGDDPNPVPRASGGYDTALVLGVGLDRVHGAKRLSLEAVFRMASGGPRSDAPANGFEADGLDVTLGVRF